jgi:tRNA-Thr(GGU) m(6)t(6)A37 methyltransferase TsaA
MSETIGLQTAEVRLGEVTVEVPDREDAHLIFIGTLHTPWPDSRACPRFGDSIDGPVCRIDIEAPWRAALAGLASNSHVQVLYWMHRARRDLVRQSPRSDGTTTGTFALRSPNRPNPIAASVCALVSVGDDHLMVRGLDCIDGTPLLDLKPIKCPEAPRPKA